MKHRLPLLLTIALASAARLSALPASYYASDSRLASGHWVKVSTTAEGIYQLTYDDLRNLGFDKPERVQVYGYHATSAYMSTGTSHFKTTDHVKAKNSFSQNFPDDLQPVATRHTADGRILFYGEGDHTMTSAYSRGGITSVAVSRNYYDTASHYFLSDCDGVTPVTVRPEGTASSHNEPFDTHICIEAQEEELQAPNNGGIAYLGRSYSMGANVPFTFGIKNYKTGPKYSDGSFLYCFGIKSPSDTRFSVTAPTTVSLPEVSGSNNTSAPGISDSNATYTECTGYLPFAAPTGSESLADGEYTFTINIPAGQATLCATDYVVLRYPRLNRLDADDPCLVMNLQEGANYSGHRILFPDTDEGEVELWNIDSPSGPSAYKAAYDSETRSTVFTLDVKSWRTVAFNPALTFPSPQVAGPVPNQNIHGMDVPDMLIITTAEYMTQAERLAELHRSHQGYDVLVLDHRDIYNEFSSGTRDVMAYRRLAKMFHDRDGEKFRYLLFFGPAYYDNRCVISPASDRLACYEQDIPSLSRNRVTNYATDSYFSFLADNYNHDEIHFSVSDIAVGRVSAINTGQAQNYVDKVARFMANPPSSDYWHRALLLGGSGDSNLHVLHSYDVFQTMAMYNPATNFVTCTYNLYQGDGQRNTIVSALSEGSGYMTFSGHGGPTYIEGWSTQLANSHSYEYPTFAMFSSCDQFSFDRMRNGLMESMLFKADGGAIAGVAATRSVYIEHNQLACLNVARAYATAKPGDNYGDLLVRARDLALDSLRRSETLPQNPFGIPQTPFRNLLAYAFAGDPAIPVCAPARAIEVTSAGDGTESSPYKPLTVEGRITMPDGSTDTAFDGTATVTVYDGFSSKEYAYAKNMVFDYPVRDKVMTRDEAAVAEGRFKVDIMLPAPALPASSYRISIAAVSADGLTAHGTYDSLSIKEVNPDDIAAAGTEAPEILEFGIADSSLTGGGIASTSPTVRAVINPSATGLRFQNGDINTRTRLVIDGNINIGNLEGNLHRDTDGNYVLEARAGTLSDGLHTIELVVANNLGLTDRATIDVTTISASLRPEIVADRHVADSEATIDYDGTAEYSRLIIADAAGYTVRSVENPAFPYKWDLTDAQNNAVPDGRYKATLLVRSGRDYGHSEPVHIVVLR